jgi:hypothetical protein
MASTEPGAGGILDIAVIVAWLVIAVFLARDLVRSRRDVGRGRAPGAGGARR